MTGTLINDIIETVDNRLVEAKKLRQWADEGPITEAQSSRYLDRAEALEEAVRESEFPFDDNNAEPLDKPETVEEVMERAPFLFPLDHIEAAEPLDEMERRTR